MNSADGKKEIKTDLSHGLELLQTLRDEIRLRIHLAGMEAKEEWGKLETKVSGLESVTNVTHATRTLVDETIDQLKKLRAKLG